MHVALVAGEASGDILGAALIRSIRERLPDARFSGVAGPQMREAGCEVVAGVEELSVMGLAEVLRELPRLLKLRRRLVAHFTAQRPDVFVGIDAPDFNLGLEKRLRASGIRTVHWVSPSVWAWRRGRINGIRRAVDQMLCLLPFEEEIYRSEGIPAVYTGHPLADEIEPSNSTQAARETLGLPADGPVVAVLPGSRAGELKYLADPFAAAAALLAPDHAGVRFVVPLAKASLRPMFEAAIARHAPSLPWQLVDGQSRAAMQAADIVLLASGTAALECLLVARPMVVAYRTSAVTAFLMLKAGLLKVEHVSLPNLLSEEPVVPELLQEEATPENLAAELDRLLRSPELRRRQLGQFEAVRAVLRCGAAGRAANAILSDGR